MSYFRFGRKKTMFGYSLLKIVGLLLSMFSPSYLPFVVGRFLIGLAGSGTFLPAYVLGNH